MQNRVTIETSNYIHTSSVILRLINGSALDQVGFSPQLYLKQKKFHGIYGTNVSKDKQMPLHNEVTNHT